MPKRILFLLPGFNFGGTVFSTLNMIAFLRKDYDVTVLPMTYQGPVIENYRTAGVTLMPEITSVAAMMGRIDREKSKWKKAAFFVHKLCRRIGRTVGFDYADHVFRRAARRIEREQRFDFVASCQEGGSTYFAARFEKSRRVAWFRSEYRVYKGLLTSREIEEEQRIYPLFDRIVCVSQTTRDDFCLYFKGITEKVFAVHNIQFVDAIIQKSGQTVDDAFPNSTFNIVSVGRFAPQKRFSQIPQIAATLKRNGVSFLWHIIGDGNMEGEYDKTQRAIKTFGVQDRVVCEGARLNPYPYIAMADLSVTPSYYEACPRVVIEAKILHTPVVCADFSSAREFVAHDVDGYVDDIERLADYIERLVCDGATYSRIKRECDKYTIDNSRIYRMLTTIFS